MDEDHPDLAETTTSFTGNSDICQQLLDRYAHSSAPQHRHLCATAAATRSIIQSSDLPLAPVSYFASTITSLSNSKSLDSTALAALTSFLSIVLPLVQKGEIKHEKAAEAVGFLVEIVEESSGSSGTSSVRALVKCVGVLVAEFCNSNDWYSVKLGLEWLLKFSLDKRPKVRKCAQDCVLMVFKSFESSAVIKKASTSVYSLLKDHMALAVKMTLSESVDGSKDDTMSRPEYQEVIHLLNVIKHAVPYLSVKMRSKVLSQLMKITSPQFSAVTRHIFDIISVIFETSGAEVIVPSAEDIINLLVSYISLGDKNPVDTSLFAATLAKTALIKLHDGDIKEWTVYLPMVTESISGLLSSEADTALKASNIFKELINCLIDGKNFSTIKNQGTEDEAIHSDEFEAIKTTCTILYNAISTSSLIPNEHFLAAIAFLFLKLGEVSDIFMKDIVLTLADLMNVASGSALDIEHLQDCIGSAIVAMGPEKLLGLLPISLSAKDLSCSNTWLIPILKKNIVGSSLGFFMSHIIPLAESFQKASCKVKKTVIGQDLQAYARGCWELLPAFCCKPSDTCQNFGALAKLLIPFLKKDSSMLEDIATSLQELVNENKSALVSDQGSGGLTKVQNTGLVENLAVDLKSRHFYSKKIASRNVKALASASKELLQALTNVLFETPPDKRRHLKGAIECLASITDSSVTTQIFTDSLEKFQLIDDIHEHEKLESEANGSPDEEDTQDSDATSIRKVAKRCQILDLASCFADGSSEDLVKLIYSVIRRAIQATGEVGHVEAYQTLSRILEKHSWFCSSHFAEVIDLLIGVKCHITSLKSRFACFRALLIHAIMSNVDEDNTKAFLILNEIILALKDSNEEGRKASYDFLNGINSELRNSSNATSDGPYHKVISMIMGYLSGSSPHIKSGVVAALSVFVYNDPNICLLMPDIVPSVLELLHSKAVEVTKAVLGFVKVLVSCLQTNDLQHFLFDIVNAILPWSSNSRYHFRSKVTIILEIMMRKSGSGAIKALVPEKYKHFVQGVLENRHGKTSSKVAGTTETKPELSDLSPKRHQKRKFVGSAILSKEEGSRGPKRTREKKQDAGKSSKRIGDYNHDHLKRGKSNQPQGGDTGAKKHMERTKMKQKNEGNVHRPQNTSKISKHKKAGKKQKKIN
ncbi:ARM repeat superfamily protein [Forsythia ovata]|uniref:ARM repeat superfamily protein n=1 Tax=Forsythia ovata TaxID=205694 RepID=A0ABD1SN23_9LAMI